LSTPLQEASLDPGVPGVQLFTTLPATQLVVPLAEQAPTPQVTGTGT
jgi:hypothetical protein